MVMILSGACKLLAELYFTKIFSLKGFVFALYFMTAAYERTANKNEHVKQNATIPLRLLHYIQSEGTVMQ